MSGKTTPNSLNGSEGGVSLAAYGAVISQPVASVEYPGPSWHEHLDHGSPVPRCFLTCYLPGRISTRLPIHHTFFLPFVR